LPTSPNVQLAEEFAYLAIVLDAAILALPSDRQKPATIFP
jgi:hypothetical protein